MNEDNNVPQSPCDLESIRDVLITPWTQNSKKLWKNLFPFHMKQRLNLFDNKVGGDISRKKTN